MKALLQSLGTTWCRLMHPAPMWSSHGRYQCRSCGRGYAVPWERGAAKCSYRLTAARVAE